MIEAGSNIQGSDVLDILHGGEIALADQRQP